MNTILMIIQILLAAILSLLIFLQSSGDSESRSNILSPIAFEKRGWEKAVFMFTLLILFLFIVSSIIQTLI